MGLVINTNIASLIATNNLSSTQGSLQKDISHLSSGLRIATAADDAAGLAISEKLKADTASYQQAARNANDGISAMQVAEGGLSQVSNILTRMKELAVEAANGTTSDRTSLDQEFQQLKSEMVRIGNTTTFNGTDLLKGSFNTSLQVGLTSSETLGLDLASVDLTSQSGAALNVLNTDEMASAANAASTNTSSALTTSGTFTGASDQEILVKVTAAGTDATAKFQFSTDGGTTWNGADLTAASDVVTLTTGNGQNANGVTATLASGGNYVAGDTWTIDATASRNLGTQAGAKAAMANIDADISSVSQFRGTIGSYQNRLGYTVANLQTMAQNTQASESQITDEDFATGMADFTKHQVLQQAGVAILSQANSLTQSVLKLLG